MIGSGRVMGHGRELPHAGELLAIEAIDQTGLIVTSEGAFVRIFKVTPPNPLLMSAPEQDKTRPAFSGSCRSCAPRSRCRSTSTRGR